MVCQRLASGSAHALDYGRGPRGYPFGMAVEGPDETAPDEQDPPDTKAGGPTVCAECGGTGRVGPETCDACRGTGNVEEDLGGD